MKLPNVKGLINLGKVAVMANRPEILLGTAIATTLGSVILAARGGYKSGVQVTNLELADDKLLSTQEKAVLTWQNYLPAAGATVVSLGSTCGLHWIHVREKKALVATGLAALQEAREELNDYIEDLQEAVDENATPKSKEKIKETLLEKQADRNEGKLKVWSDGVITEMYLVRDARTGRDIWSNQVMIDDALNELNRVLTNDGEADVNTFYEQAGYTRTPDGDDYGWNAGDTVGLKWATTVRDDGRPVREFRFHTEPEKGFDRKTR